MGALADRERIRDRYAATSFAVDLRDADGLADCYMADAVVEVVGRRRIEGRSAITATLASPSHNLHLTSNLWIRAVSDRSAKCSCYMLLVDRATGRTTAYGHYEDELVCCDDGEWRFALRHVHYLWTSDSYIGAGQSIDSRQGRPPHGCSTP